MPGLVQQQEGEETATPTTERMMMSSQGSHDDVLAEFTAPYQEGSMVKAVLGGRCNTGTAVHHHRTNTGSSAQEEAASFVERHSSASSLQDLHSSMLEDDDDDDESDLEAGAHRQQRPNSYKNKRMSSKSRFPWERGDLLEQQQADQEARLQEELTETESQGICRLRMLVVAILILTTISVSVIVYVVTTKGETDAFKTQYEGAAAKVIECKNTKFESVCFGCEFTTIRD